MGHQARAAPPRRLEARRYRAVAMIAAVEILVRDVAAAERFYGELLHDKRVRLVEGVADDGWVDDDRQLGNRHLALYVGDVDAEAARLKAAGVKFTIEPLDATGARPRRA